MMQGLARVLAVLVAYGSCSAPATAQSGLPGAEARAKANEWTIGLAAGLPEDSFLPIAAEISRNLNDSGSLRVLPLATPGAANNIKDLLFLNGIDVALTQNDALHHLRTVEKIPQIEKRVHFVAALAVSEVHLLVRPEIRNVQDLAGKKVGFNVPGAGPTITAPIVFQALNVTVEPVFVSNAEALAMMQSGAISGLVHTATKPNTLISSIPKGSGFKLLPLPYEKLDQFYMPAEFNGADYPNLIEAGRRVETIAVQALLAVLDRPTPDRARRVRRFIDLFFERFDRFKGPGYQASWRDVNLSAQVPGWIRSEAATQKLQQEIERLRRGAPKVAVMPPAEQERLFQRFLVWLKDQPAR